MAGEFPKMDSLVCSDTYFKQMATKKFHDGCNTWTSNYSKTYSYSQTQSVHDKDVKQL